MIHINKENIQFKNGTRSKSYKKIKYYISSMYMHIPGVLLGLFNCRCNESPVVQKEHWLVLVTGLGRGGGDKCKFLKILKVQCHFLISGFISDHDSQLYRQTDGVVMGSPPGSTFANAFICYYENKWLVVSITF